MIIKVKENGFVNLDEFKDLIDISKVVYYKLVAKKDKSLSLKFYDKDKKLVKPKSKKYYQLIFFSNDLVFNPMIARFESLLELNQEVESCKKYKDYSYYIQEVNELDYQSKK